MRNSMRWPLISLVGQAPVCQALEKFRGNLCHLDARERSFCTPRMYICLLRAILPWYPCLHSRLNFMYNWIGFYIYIAEEHLQYRIVRILCNHWGMFENTTLQTWCVLYTSLKISFSCSVWGEKSWCTTVKFTSTEAPSNWQRQRTSERFIAQQERGHSLVQTYFCKGFAVKETWGKPHSNLDKSDKDISTCPYSAIIVAN